MRRNGASLGELETVLAGLVERVARRMRKAGRCGRTVVLRLRFDDYSRASRSRTLPRATAATAAIMAEARRLLRAAAPTIERRGITLIGITVSNLDGEQAGIQLELPLDPRAGRLDRALDELRERFGAAARFTGRVDEDDVGAWFTAADLALLPYPRPFSSSGALAHALAHGTPVLLSEALADSVGATRELAVAADAEAIAAALGELAIRPAGLEPLRAQAHDLAGGRSWPAVARRHLELYEEVLHADGAHRRRAHAA